MRVTIEDSLSLFSAVINDLCADKASIGEYSVAKCRRTVQNGKIEHFYRYDAIFKYGPFNENNLVLKKEYFRLLDLEELNNLVINTLSSTNFFVFDKKKGVFNKRFLVM